MSEPTLKLDNDLMTPRPEYRLKGLKHGDKWCLCALRWINLAQGSEVSSLCLKNASSLGSDII